MQNGSVCIADKKKIFSIKTIFNKREYKMIKTIIDSAKGVYSTNNDSGLVVEPNTANTGFAPYAHGIMGTITNDITLSSGNAGVWNFSGSVANTAVMANPATCPGALFTFHSLTAVANILSGSGSQIFSSGTTKGTKLVLSGVVGACVSFISDGSTYILLGGFGTNTIT
jgi:hypothetical protein